MKPNWRDEVKVCACGEKYWPTASISRHNWNIKAFCSTKCPALALMHRKRREAATERRVA